LRHQVRKFPSIEQFRHAVERVTHKATYAGQAEDGTPRYDPSRPKPTLTFVGTTKLHGTNGGVELDLKTNSVTAQSKERVLTVDDDNHGFCAWVESASGSAACSKLFDVVKGRWTNPTSTSIHIFGEWCGPTVNAKTAIGQLTDRFVVFAVLVTDESGVENWLEPKDVSADFYQDGVAPKEDFRFICEFKQWTLVIDFNDPVSALDELERLTLEVEQSCPVAQALGGEGLGEGIVWVCRHPEFGRIVFKTKGEKHVGTKGAGRLVNIAPEVLASREAFVDAVLTDSRLEQGFDLLVARYGKVTKDHLGEFLKWIGTDVMKEEADTLEASGLDRKDVMGSVNRQAKTWVTPRLSEV
jgi:hypothetical protein